MNDRGNERIKGEDEFMWSDVVNLPSVSRSTQCLMIISPSPNTGHVLATATDQSETANVDVAWHRTPCPAMHRGCCQFQIQLSYFYRALPACRVKGVLLQGVKRFFLIC